MKKLAILFCAALIAFALLATPTGAADTIKVSNAYYPIQDSDNVTFANCTFGDGDTEIWHNGGKSWADNYHTVFHKDGTVEHFGHRNFDKGTYKTENDGSIRAVFNDCKYDFPGEGHLKVSGYTCIYRLSDDGKELSRDCDRDDSVEDNDSYYKPLRRTNDFVESSEY